MKANNIIEKKMCTGCMACKNICPKNAITMYEEEDGFYYPKINQEKCIQCGLCKKVCPVLNKLDENNYKIKVYACINKQKDERMNSSSGGIFTAIAKYIINNNGVVFGVKFNEKLEAIHSYIENEEEIEQFRRSKYVQSNINDMYIKVKEVLKKDRKVLFTGTPCQIEGLLSYLGKDYNNLYTQDIICHGVPSPKVWKKYIEYKKREKGEYPTQVNFRRKDILGWSNFQVSYRYSKLEENFHHDEDIYMKLFLNNLDLRESCYNCSFKKINRKSDITIADFWGINKVFPELNDELGVSAIIINSKKGEIIFENIKENLEYKKTDIDSVISSNSCMVESVKYNNRREEFFKKLNESDFKKMIDEFI